MGMTLHAILKGCMKIYLSTSDTPLIYFHQPLHLHDSVATVRCSVTADESSLISLRKGSASVNTLSIPTPPKILPLFRRHISSLSYVLAKDTPVCSISVQAHSTTTLIFFPLMKPSLKAHPLARKRLSIHLLNWCFNCSVKCRKSKEGQKIGHFQECRTAANALRELSSLLASK